MKHLIKFFLIVFIITIITENRVYCQSIEFSFNPPDNLSYYQTLKSTKVMDMGELGKRTEISEFRAKIDVKKDSTGFSLTTTPVSVKMLRDGQEISDPILTLLQKIVFKYTIDNEGQIISVKGFENLLDLMLESLPPQMIQPISSVLNKETLAKKEIAEWNSRIGDFAGLKTSLGQVFAGTDEFLLPTGKSATYYTVTKIAEKTKVGNDECLRITFSYNSDKAALRELFGEVVDNISESTEAGSTNSEISIEGEGERVINPSNMLIYSEKIKRTLRMELDIPNKGKISTTRQEERTYIYEY